MSCSTISTFGNIIFSEILNEMKLFSKYKVKYYDDIDLCVRDAENNNQFVVFFVSKVNQNRVKRPDAEELKQPAVSTHTIVPSQP